jgi:3,4-dihydroxy 2-butanone 4-phosphate synthase/GTP cyclohydrolase II
MESHAVRTNALRDYGVGAQILGDLGVRDMILLASAPTRLAASAGYGLKIVGHMPIAQTVE